MAQNAQTRNEGRESQVHGSLGGTEENTNAIAALGKGLPAPSHAGAESTMQGLIHQNVENVGFGGGMLDANGNPMNVLDNTDEIEPGKAVVNQQVQIQQRQKLLETRTPAVAASMQATHMPKPPIMSDMMSVGGKSQLHQRTGNAQDLLGEAIATRSHHTEDQVLNRAVGGGMITHQPNAYETNNDFQEQAQMGVGTTMDKKLVEEPHQAYENADMNDAQMAVKQPPNYQMWKQDPKLLTKSTLEGGDGPNGKFLPKIEASGDLHQQQMMINTKGQSTQVNPNGGYISDFYKKKQYTSSDGSNKMAMQMGQLGQNNMNGMMGHELVGGSDTGNEVSVPMGKHPQKLNKISSKKFFKSKIDFTAPIKSLQHKGGTHDPNLSDDSYMVDNNQAAFQQFTQGQNMSQGQFNNQSHLSHMSGARPINQSEINNRPSEKYVAGDLPMTQMEGYTNLSLIKEEDFNKQGVGHLHHKNASKRVYQNARQGRQQNTNSIKGRKASEATTVGQNGGSLPASRKQYSSVENRFQTPLKLPNLRTPGTKKNSSATSQHIRVQPHPSNLSTVIESAYSKGHTHIPGKVCHICAKKPKVVGGSGHGSAQHHHSNNPSFGGGQNSASGVKGAPYYQPMSLQKPPHGKPPGAFVNQRSNSNGRGPKTYNRQLRQAPPKWLSKEYKPVFKMGGTSGGREDSQTIQHRSSGDFVQAASSTSKGMPAKRPEIVTLNNSQIIQRSFDNSLSPRSDQPSGNTMPFTNSFKNNQLSANSPDLNKMVNDVTLQSQKRSTLSNMSRKQQSQTRPQPHTAYQDHQNHRSQKNTWAGSQNAPNHQTRNQASPGMAARMNSTGSTVYSITPTAAHQIQQYKQLPMAYRSINKFDKTFQSSGSRVMEQGRHPQDPELICTEKNLPENIEEEIKDGFFELKQKFKEVGPSSIYISHVTLHEKHPLLRKIEVETLKTLLLESSVIYLSVNQTLYRYGSQDNFVYIILFGKLLLQVPDRLRSNRNGDPNGNETDADQMTQMSQQTHNLIGRVNIGWTLGEEILFDRNLQIRQEMAVAETESCLIGINKAQLAIMQKNLLEQGNEKDYFVIESILKGNFLVKDQWRREYHEGILNSKGQHSETASNISNANIKVVNPVQKRALH